MSGYEVFENEYDTTDQVKIHMEPITNAPKAVFHEYNEDKLENGISDPSVNPTPENNDLRAKLRNIVEHMIFRLFGFLLILVDITLLIIDLSMQSKDVGVENGFDITAVVFGTYFMIEVSVRFYAKGMKEFVQAWYNVVDLCVIVLSYIVTIVYATASLNHTPYAKLIVVGRLVRIFLFVRVCTERKQIENGARHVVSQNKRRYRKDGFDLDLTYVTEKVIAMSFPSSGKMSMYRNPIKQVAKFMNTKHPDHYRIYNLCSERSYDTSYFHGHVRRFMIDDHNVPLLKEMIGFCTDAEKWLNSDPKNIIAVHCKGGKGRTGSMICVWLIHSNLFETANESLSYFGDRRTDLKVGTKFQGIETPSQNRYVGYYNEIHKIYNGGLPPIVTLKLTGMNITCLSPIGAGDGSDLWCEIFIGKERVSTCMFGTNMNCHAEYDGLKDVLKVSFQNCPNLTGDIRIKFHCTSEKVPKNYENCPFYFWFHTSFIRDNRLYIPREELDNPHKAKTWKTFHEKFAVEVLFDTVQENPE